MIDGAGGFVTNALDVATGRNHLCMLRTGGTVSCFGRNENGELGNGMSGTASPSAITMPSTVMAIVP